MRAAAEGWGVYECIDEKTLKIFYVVQEFGKRFADASAARAFVLKQSNTGDALATRAIRAVFRSKVGSKARSK